LLLDLGFGIACGALVLLAVKVFAAIRRRFSASPA
jgi:hypothetical protein